MAGLGLDLAVDVDVDVMDGVRYRADDQQIIVFVATRPRSLSGRVWRQMLVDPQSVCYGG